MLGQMLDHFLERLARTPEIADLLAAAAEKSNNIVVNEARGGSVPALLTLLARRLGRPLLVITSSIERAETLTDGLDFFGAEPLIFPNFETLPYETVEPVIHIAAGRNQVLARLVRGAGTPPLIVAPVDSLLSRPLPREALARQHLRLSWGEAIDIEAMARQLVEMGYAREALVESPGEFSVRGSIVDVYPPDADWPWRLDFFGDEIEQIRLFDPSTQRSRPLGREIEAVDIHACACHAPKIDWLLQGGRLGSFFDLLPPETLVAVDGPGRVHQRALRYDDVARRHWLDIGRIKDAHQANVFIKNGMEPGEWLLTSDEARDALGRFQRLEFRDLLAETDQPLDGADGAASPDAEATAGDESAPGGNGAGGDWRQALKKLSLTQPEEGATIDLRPTTRKPSPGAVGPGATPDAAPRPDPAEAPPPDPDAAVFEIGAMAFESIPSQFPEYLGLFRERLRKGHWVAIVCDNNGQLMRLDELLRENELSAAVLDGDPAAAPPIGLPRDPADPCPDILLMTGDLHEGFHCPRAGVMIVTDREIFGRYRRRHVYRKVYHGRPIANPAEINRGDFVVHVEHGIGLFEGIRRQVVDGRQAEFLELTYQEGNKLLVPVEKLHLIQKYASADGKPPVLDRLGGKKWSKRRKKTMEAVRKMAGELLELYARRAAAEGFAYTPDTTWQQEFEASFLYQETPDQLRAIDEVKADMMEPKPMDRLVCGDVGYGKTEVAIRAAFKALVEGRQVAVLAPTTLLVAQHYSTFRERFADYPFKVEMLSRFRDPRRQKEIIEELIDGSLNLVVGTHRLLSRDVSFKDLGLLVVDEEQRFGVAQKEKIKSLRASVDILTLTATPIPRTLYMALSGIRDLSVINTPPANRHPIKTRTIHWDREMIEEAILRELNRGGQVFFVHNRIESIDEVAQRIREIVPRARLVVAHGQMEEHVLEQIMTDFIAGKFDILLSTTIIENGIDIPNVNTIVINRADTFGLAQLYQLRGRVGRDVRQAYAYLILPPGQAITPQAIKRLEALEEFTELGVGFSIAMRDMEIRGTGNILGAEQHGAITDVGFEMYCKLLEEAVAEMRGVDLPEPLWPVEIKFPVDQFLPEDYIPIESQRIRFYKDVAGTRTRDELELLLEELVDRYGALPPPAVNLVNACRVKLAASPWRVDTIRFTNDKTVRLAAPVFATELAAAMAERAEAGRAAFSRLQRQVGHVILQIRQTGGDIPDEQVLAALADFLEALPALESATR
ncbi:MAG: transcription-repair coupling factor [bacterium]|nr:transcription-repair coupling factor [bacterium]